MAGAEDPFKSLRDALGVSPENLPMRQHIASSLLAAGRSEEAAKEFREALARWPDNPDLKLGLARSFYHLGKNGESLVIA